MVGRSSLFGNDKPRQMIIQRQNPAYRLTQPLKTLAVTAGVFILSPFCRH